MLDYLKSRSDKTYWMLILSSLLIVFFYKYYKTLFQISDPAVSYLANQHIYTAYRVFGTIVSGIILYKTYKSFFKHQKLLDSKWIILSVVMLGGYFLKKLFYFDAWNDYAFVQSWYHELYFNFFTGFYEEFTFRGMLLVGMLGVWKDKVVLVVIINSLIFTFWHYDVVHSWTSYSSIFLMSLLFCIMYLKGCHLFIISMFHFLWDQVHFGFVWSYMPIGQDYQVFLCALIIFYLGLIKIVSMKKVLA